MEDQRENGFREYLNILIKDFENIDFNKVRGHQCDTIHFCKKIIKELIKLMKTLETADPTSCIKGAYKFFDYSGYSDVGIALKDPFRKLSIPDNIDNFLGKNLFLGNGYEIGFFGIPNDYGIRICNRTITSPKSGNSNGNIILYKASLKDNSDGKSYWDHNIFIFNPIANLNFINHYVSNFNFIKHYEESGGDVFIETNYVDNLHEFTKDAKVTGFEVDEDDGESEWDLNDGWKEDSTQITVSESDNTESAPSDNNKTLNFSLPGPNGTKMSINLTINITFE